MIQKRYKSLSKTKISVPEQNEKTVVSGTKNYGDDDIDRVTVFSDRVRLELESSFTGEDLLFT